MGVLDRGCLRGHDPSVANATLPLRKVRSLLVYIYLYIRDGSV